MLIDLVIRDLSGGDIPDDSPYDRNFVLAHIINGIREDLKLELLQRGSGAEADRTPITQYIATYEDVPLEYNSKMFESYIDLPSGYMSLKHNKGIHWVADMRTPMKQMIPVANPGVTQNLPHADLERINFSFYVEGLKIKFTRNIKAEEVTKIFLKLIIPAPDGIGLDEPIALIPENVGRITDIAKKRVQNLAINDRLADGNPNIRPANV